MTDIIKNWLTQSLGFTVNVESESFVQQVQNGYLISQILNRLHLISDHQLKADESEVDFEYVAAHLETLGFRIDDETKSHIKEGKVSSIIKLLYELYLAFKSEDKLSKSHWEISSIDLSRDRESKNYNNINNWHSTRYTDLLERCKNARDEYIQYARNTTIRRSRIIPVTPLSVMMFDVKSENGSVNYTYDELIEERNKARAIKLEGPDPQISKRIVNKIQKKNEEGKVQAILQTQMEGVLLDELWHTVLTKDLENAERNTSQKMLKQSSFEKQIAIIQFEDRNARNSLIQKRKADNDTIQQIRDNELVEEIFAKRSGDEEKIRYYYERDQALQLHKRIYAAKLHLKKLRMRDMCFNIVEDLVDLAVRPNEEISDDLRNEFTTTLVTEQTLSETEEPIPEEIEEIDLDEFERQVRLDAKAFEDYSDFKWPWELGECSPNLVDKLDDVQLAANVLGHVVFRLLLTKYPEPAEPVPPDLPKVDIAVSIDDISDPKVLETLIEILKERQVKVIRMEDAVDYCVEAYKSETLVEYPETEFVYENEAEVKGKKGKKGKNKKDKKTKSKSSKDKKTKSTKSSKSSKGKKKKKSEIDLKEIVPPVQDKHLQTPRLFPCQEFILSPKAVLGGAADDILQLGQTLNDALLVNTFIEYLKSLKDLKGWVLINYPKNLQQVSLLEEALTAVPVPCNPNIESGSDSQVSTIEETSISASNSRDCVDCTCPKDTNEFVADFDKNAQYRTSKLLTKPDPPKREALYKTYLTAYVHVIQSTPEGELTLRSVEHGNTINKFYQNQGCLYFLYYKTYDFPTIKHLAKLIIGDYSIPPKTSVQILGDNISLLEENFNRQKTTGKKDKTKSSSKGSKKKGKPKKDKKKKSSTKGSKAKTAKSKKGSKKGKFPDGAEVVIVREDKETQIPEIEPYVEEVPEPPEPPSKPGDLRWQYSDLDIPRFFQIALASWWENIEEIYVTGFKDVFFNLRTLFKGYVPYMNCVKEFMKTFIARPDDKQIYLRQFQNIFNEFDEEMRRDDAVKEELKCRIYQFREKMWEICDERMRSAEDQRKTIAAEDWMTKQTCELTNGYVAELQLELDRCSDTLQLVNDYYTAMITKMVSQAGVLEKTFLTYIPYGDDVGLPQYSNFLKNALLSKECMQIESPFHDLFGSNWAVCAAVIESNRASSLVLIEKMESYLDPNSNEQNYEADDDKGRFERKLPKFSEPPYEVKKAGFKLIEEWKCVVNGEVLRTECRLNVLKCHAKTELQAVINYMCRTFAELKKDASGRYRREINSIQGVYDIFYRAIADEIALQPELILVGDRFYMKPSVMLFENSISGSDLFIQEVERLNMEQLNNLVRIFADLAPNGIMKGQAFSYLIQDMMTHKVEKTLFPASWQQVYTSNSALKTLGNIERVNWKDFIVYNLCMPFPTEEELMETRKQFREYDVESNEFVYVHQYDAVKFWFDKLYDSPQIELKKLLRKMYQISEDTINYTALLLNFCKDDEPVVGIAKALELSLGKYVCWQEDLGEAFKDNIRLKREIERQEKALLVLEEIEAVDTAGEVMENLIDKTVHVCDSCVLEELVSVTELVTEEDVSDEISELTQQLPENSTYSSLLLDEEFSNVEIGYEVSACPPKVYYLPFEALSTVLTAAIPWFRTPESSGDLSLDEKMKIAYESCRNEEFGGNVLAHEFLKGDAFQNLMKHCNKFVAMKPSATIEQLLHN